MLSGDDVFIHKRGTQWEQVYKQKNTTKILEHFDSPNEKYQINLFIPVNLYDEHIINIEVLLQKALNDEVILLYKKIGGTKTNNTETMQESFERSNKKNHDPKIIEKKSIIYNNPVAIFPGDDVQIEELAYLCMRLEESLKNIQEENHFVSKADVHLTRHLYFRRVSLYEEHVDIFTLSHQHLILLKELASKSYLFEKLESHIYSNRQIQKYINQLRNDPRKFNELDKIIIKNLCSKIDNIENDMMGISDEEDSDYSLNELRIIAMEQTIVNTYREMREQNFLGISVAADALEKIINSPDKMGLENKYGDTCRVPRDPTSHSMPLICKRYVSSGKVFFNLRALQNENFMFTAMQLIIDKIKDKSDFENKCKLDIGTVEYIESCFNYYFSDPNSPSDAKINWLKIYSFHDHDVLNDHSKIGKFRMQIILTDLIHQQICGTQNAGLLINNADMIENKKNYPFTYAYQQLKIHLSRITTHRPQLNSLMRTMREYDQIIDEENKFQLLKAKIYEVRVEVNSKVHDETRFFKCFAQSNFVNALNKFEKEIIDDLVPLLEVQKEALAWRHF